MARRRWRSGLAAAVLWQLSSWILHCGCSGMDGAAHTAAAVWPADPSWTTTLTTVSRPTATTTTAATVASDATPATTTRLRSQSCFRTHSPRHHCWRRPVAVARRQRAPHSTTVPARRRRCRATVVWCQSAAWYIHTIYYIELLSSVSAKPELSTRRRRWWWLVSCSSCCCCALSTAAAAVLLLLLPAECQLRLSCKPWANFHTFIIKKAIICSLQHEPPKLEPSSCTWLA